VQGGEQPGFHFIGVAQLMALGGPYVKCLLRQIARIRLRSRQAEGKLVEWLIETSHQAFKIPSRGHSVSSPIRAAANRIVPAMQLRRPNLSWCASGFERKIPMAPGTFLELETLTLREGILAIDLSSDLEASSLPTATRVSAIRSTVMSAGHPQDYGGFVADPRLVEVVDKALSKD